MKVMNVARMREEIAKARVATPYGQDAQVGLLVEDLEGMTDEIEVSRQAVHDAAEAMDFARVVLYEALSMISKPKNRVRISQAIAKIAALLDDPEEVKLTPEEAQKRLDERQARQARARLVGPDGRRLE